MFEIHGWGYLLYVACLVIAAGCGYAWRICDELARERRRWEEDAREAARFMPIEGEAVERDWAAQTHLAQRNAQDNLTKEKP